VIVVAETGGLVCRSVEHCLRLKPSGAQRDLINERQLIRAADFGSAARIIAIHADFDFADLQT